MRQVNKLINVESIRLVVCKDLGAGGSWLSNDQVGARVIEEHVVRKTGVPGLNTVRTTETSISYKKMSATIKVTGSAVRSNGILL